MNKNFESEALKKIDEGKTAKLGRTADCMKESVAAALKDFIAQDAEFAQAVAQGGSFADCMAAVAQGVGSHISDLEAYSRAAEFYFKGCKVRFKMELELCPGEHTEQQAESKPAGLVLDLSAFL